MSERQIDKTHFSKDIQEFIRLLHKHGVQFVIIGGEAVIFHGYPRYTGDVDFFYRAEETNARKLYQALDEFWLGNIPAIEHYQELLEPGIIVQFGRPPNRIDLLSKVDGIDFEQAWHGRVPATFSGIELSFLGVEQLVAAKEAAGRPKDLEDLRYLQRLLDRRD